MDADDADGIADDTGESADDASETADDAGETAHLAEIFDHLALFPHRGSGFYPGGGEATDIDDLLTGQRGGRPCWLTPVRVHSSLFFGGSMRTRQSLVLDTARHVQGFLDDNAARIGPSIASSRRNLDDVVAQLTTLSVAQSSGQIASRGATARQRSLRATLRSNHMKPIAEVAKQTLKDVPEFHSLTMPPRRFGATQLVHAATAMADAAELHEAVFTDVGLPDDFIVQLHAAAGAVTTSLDGRQQQVAQTTGATAGLKAQESRARSLFKLINAIVVPKLGSNAVLLAQWKSTKAISQKTTSAIVPPSTVPQNTPASPATRTTDAPTSPAQSETTA